MMLNDFLNQTNIQSDYYLVNNTKLIFISFVFLIVTFSLLYIFS
jgi:hypothetical protein